MHFFASPSSPLFGPALPRPTQGWTRAAGEHVIDTSDPPRVLCVDDNPDVADSIAVLLEISGYEARACYNGASALAKAEIFAPDICLIDLNMPGMDGDVLAIHLREAGRPLLLAAVTAMSSEESCLRIAAAGFDLHLVKPVDPRRLLAAIGTLWQARPRARGTEDED